VEIERHEELRDGLARIEALLNALER